MLTLYRLLAGLLCAPVLLLLHRRGRRNGEPRGRWRERTGRTPFAPEGGVAAWVHAVSVGEVQAARPVIDALITRHGERRVVVTVMTTTGSAQVRHLWGERVLHSYVPYDLSGFVRRFLDRVRPHLVVVMETELWPNTYRALAERGIPLVVANARLSPRSLRGYGRIGRLVRDTLRCASLIAAQSDADAERFRALGAPRVVVTGNVKFDLSVPEVQRAAGRALRQRIGERRPVWVAASTHDGEEATALAAHEQVLAWHPDALLILVPRHPQRFDAVARAVANRSMQWRRRSRIDADGLPADCRVLLGDSMGEMFCYLAAADVAFVGGSLVEVGGHNVLEPAAIGLPVLFGPHMFNFVDSRRLLLDAGGAVEIDNGQMLAAEVGALLSDAGRRAAIGDAAARAVAANRGTVARLMRELDTLQAEDAPEAGAP